MPADGAEPILVREGQAVPLPDGVTAAELVSIDPSRFSIAIVEGTPILTVGWGVGIQRLRTATGRELLVLVFPKGVSGGAGAGRWSALARFSQLVALTCGGDGVGGEPNWQGGSDSPAEQFLLVLAGPLIAACREILQRHQRRHYRTEEEELIGRVRGRPLVSAHLRRVLAGAAHRIPCRYEEFDFDNADNRVLKSALRRLSGVAKVLAPGGRLGTNLHTLADRFIGVADTGRPLDELRRARFGRVSAPYGAALSWARMVHQGLACPEHGSQVGEFWLDAATVFQQFVARIADATGHEVGLETPGPGVFVGGAATFPDVVVAPARVPPIAIGDAKYKNVCEVLRRDRLEGPASFSQSLTARMKSADTYQLYAYLRLRDCQTGFFVVPYWDPAGKPADIDKNFAFTRPPLDSPSSARAFALGVNMGVDPVVAMHSAAGLLRAALIG